MPKETLTIPKYAEKIGKERTTVFRAVKNKKLHLLPGVVDIKKIGRDYLLEVTT